MIFQKKFTIAMAFSVIALGVTSADAANRLGSKLLNQTGIQRCPECEHCCKLEITKTEETKKCFEVEKKVICIPRVVFPWQTKPSCSSCDSCDGGGCNTCANGCNGAVSKEIKILSTKKYKCPKCKYTWVPVKKAGCDDGCCDSEAGAPEIPVPTAAQLPLKYRELAPPQLIPANITPVSKTR